MQEANWRDAWSRFRMNLVDETARCLADQRRSQTRAPQQRWESLSTQEQSDVMLQVVAVFRAQDQAMDNLVERGLSL